MSKNTTEAELVADAARFYAGRSGVSVPKSLRYAGFLKERSNRDRSLQMMVCYPPAVTTSARGKVKHGKAVSETHVTPETSTPLYVPPKPPEFQKRPGESQDTNIFKKQKKRHEQNNVHKRATALFGT